MSGPCSCQTRCVFIARCTKPSPVWSCRRRARRGGLSYTCAHVHARVPSALPTFWPFQGARPRSTLKTCPESLQRADLQAPAAGPRGAAASRRWGLRGCAPADTGAKIPFNLPIRAVLAWAIGATYTCMLTDIPHRREVRDITSSSS